MDTPIEKKFEDFKVGDERHFEITITEELISQFAQVSGDTNPLHTQTQFAKNAGYDAIVSHGMLGGALFSRLVGMYIPGTYALYLSQTLQFKKPTYPGMRLRIRGEVSQKVDALQVLKLKTTISDATTGEVLTDGEAMVRVLR